MIQANLLPRHYLETVRRALQSGLGTRTVAIWLKVIRPESDSPFVSIHMKGGNIDINGFGKMKRVLAKIAEKDGSIVARFYDGIQDLAADKPLKCVVLAKSAGNGKWTTLKNPEIVWSSKMSTQITRAEIKGINEFLLSEQTNGSWLNINSRTVTLKGAVQIKLATGQDQSISFCGYGGHRRVVGRIVVTGNTKTVYFWSSEKARDNGSAPIKPAGHIMAEKNDRNNWAIVANHSTGAWREKRQTTQQFGNYLFATVEQKTFPINWQVGNYTSGGRTQRVATKKIRGTAYQLYLNGQSGLGANLFSVTREIASRVKLVEFWPDEWNFEQGKRPINGRFITIRQDNGPWLKFWTGVDDCDKFKLLLAANLITPPAISAILADKYLINFYHPEICRLSDGLKLYG